MDTKSFDSRIKNLRKEPGIPDLQICFNFSLVCVSKEKYSLNSFGNRCPADDLESETESSIHDDDSDILFLIAEYYSKFGVVVPNENFYTTFDEISRKLLKIFTLPRPKREFQIKLLKYAERYGRIMSNWAETFHEWLDMREKNIRFLQNSLKKFQDFNKATTKITLVSRSLDFFLGVASILHSFFHFNVEPTYPIAINMAIGYVSITCSLIALTYSKKTVDDIKINFWEENYAMRKLELLYRNENWNDKDVEQLFPHGINLNLVNKHVFNVQRNSFQSWKQHVLTAILLTNIKKDGRLLNSEFLTSAKAFVESSAAQIWINRIRLRQLLDDIFSKSENLPDPSTWNKAFVNQAALNLYPTLFTLFSFRIKTKERMLCSSLTALKAAFNFIEPDKEFVDLRYACRTLQHDYKRIKNRVEVCFAGMNTIEKKEEKQRYIANC